jgi:uncharacterized protein (TIGR03435 family)
MDMLKALWVLLAVSAFAQPPAFEAAAIKPSKPEVAGSGWHTRPGMTVLTGQTLKGLISIAYDVKDFQVSGGPKWLNSDRFDINAKAEGPAKDSQMLQMLQTLLADRFQLVIHHEQKSAPAYALVVAKSGLKMKPSEATGSSSQGGKGQITATGVTMAKLADQLSRRLGVPVVDLTETPGGYDFKLQWSIDGDANDAQSALFDALQSQLGVKLEARKLPLDLIVVDKAEKLSEN